MSDASADRCMTPPTVDELEGMHRGVKLLAPNLTTGDDSGRYRYHLNSWAVADPGDGLSAALTLTGAQSGGARLASSVMVEVWWHEDDVLTQTADVVRSSRLWVGGEAIDPVALLLWHAATTRGANLQGANLRDAYLRYADLQGAYLRDADLQGAYLRYADLRGAVLRYADLRYADLRGAVLRGAVLRGAVLRGADLRYADLQGAPLRGADLRGADLRGADLRGADLRGADLRGADLRGADLQDADLQDADLRYADVTLPLGWSVVDGRVTRAPDDAS